MRSADYLKDIETVLTQDTDFLLSFNVIIAHNLNPVIVSKISELLESSLAPPSFIIIRSAGFLAEFFIQFQEHASMNSHADLIHSL